MFSNLLSNDAYKEIKFSSLHKTILYQFTNIYLIPFYLNSSTNKILHTYAPTTCTLSLCYLQKNISIQQSSFTTTILPNGDAPRSQFSRVIYNMLRVHDLPKMEELCLFHKTQR